MPCNAMSGLVRAVCSVKKWLELLLQITIQITTENNVQDVEIYAPLVGVQGWNRDAKKKKQWGKNEYSDTSIAEHLWDH